LKRILINILKRRGEIARFSLFIIAGIILVFLFPWEGKFRYEFQKGKPWQHDEFINMISKLNLKGTAF
jgi:hypothetical protein